MDFFTVEGIVLLIWGFSLMRFILRWMNGRKGSDMPSEEIPEEDYSIPETSMPQKTSSVEEDSDREYNYEELRERVLRSWEMTEKKPVEMDLPDEMEKTVYRETTASVESAVSGSVKETSRSSQMYLSKTKRTEKPKVKTSPMEVETVSSLPAVMAVNTGWSEATVRTWMKYDVVFGEPRGRKPWSPSMRN